MMAQLQPPRTTPFDHSRLRGEMRYGELMARHTTWRIGGPADYYYRPADIDDLAEILSQWPDDEPLTWFGLGSNLLVRDGGIRGLVIATSGMLNGILRLENNLVRVEAGAACPKVARYCGREGLVGAEFLAGIPGTMGGALAMNAGAFGGETWPLIESVETLDRHGVRHHRLPREYTVGYRHVSGPANEWFVAARLSLQSGDAAISMTRVKELLGQRGESQPTGLPSGGSVFRNPQGDYAGRLIEACGLKGFVVGAAHVSEKHANFIINSGAATAADIESLILHVQSVVAAQMHITLVPEIHIIGEHVQVVGDD